MRRPSVLTTKRIGLLLAIVILLGALPGIAAAETRGGGYVVVGEGETIDEDLDVYGGTIVVRGQVDGDLSAFGGDIRIEGEVTGDVEAFGGNVWIAGQVGGNVDASAGNVYVQPGTEIGGSLSVAAGNVVVAGTVHGDAELAGGAVTLAQTAAVDGDVEYAVGEEGQFTDEGASVGGTISRVREVDAGPAGPQIPGWAFDVYGFLANLALGAVLLVAFPRLSTTVADRITSAPLRSGGIGVLTAIAVPIGLLVLAITIIGLPLAVAGGLLFGLLLWVALVYGRFAAGTWLLSRLDVDNRWLALVVGLLLLGLLGRLPWVGGLVDLVVGLLGLGGVAAVGYGRFMAGR